MTILSNTFGIAARNFTAYPEMPDPRRWSTTASGSRSWASTRSGSGTTFFSASIRTFPIIDSLTTADRDRGAHQRRSSSAPGFWCCRCAIRWCWPSSLSSMDLFSGRPAAHGHGVGLVQARVRRGRRAVRQARQDHGREPRDPEPALDRGAWSTANTSPHKIPAAVMYPKPVQKPRMPILIGGYVDRVLQARGDGRRRLAHLFLHARRALPNPGPRSATSPRKAARIRTSCSTHPAADHGRDVARGGRGDDDGMAGKEWDYAGLERLLDARTARSWARSTNAWRS